MRANERLPLCYFRQIVLKQDNKVMNTITIIEIELEELVRPSWAIYSCKLKLWTRTRFQMYIKRF